ncbi:MAG: hypothetical protein LBK43_01340 [Treponema sp.]|nr:hypothetical protein [Treponema sp.]
MTKTTSVPWRNRPRRGLFPVIPCWARLPPPLSLASAHGAIAGYSAARDVPGVRVVFCDAEAYDQGYLQPEAIAGTVKVKGRGGTVLQPGIDLLKTAGDFPETAPILIITDGYCEDHLVLYGREHAYLIPEGRSLPFVPKGKVFRFRE